MANPKIQLRHDTSTNWQTQNPVLLEGEVAIETDSNKVKIGNGTDNYNTLPYITDQTKIDLDYSNADYQPVNKAGDTMTGALSIALSGDDTNNLIIRNDSIDKLVTPSTQKQTRIQFVDKNDADIGSIYYQQRADGSSRLSQILRGSTNNDAYSYIGYDSLGNAECTFPNTIRVDGQYVNANKTIVSNVSANGSGSLNYTLNLPNDGRNYLVWIEANVVTGTTSGNYLYANVGSDPMTQTTIARASTRASSSVGSGGTACIVVSSSHKIYLGRSTSWNGTISLQMIGYRRIGTNA